MDRLFEVFVVLLFSVGIDSVDDRILGQRNGGSSAEMGAVYRVHIYNRT